MQTLRAPRPIKRPRAAVLAAIRRYTQAALAESWKGSQPPAEHDGIAQELNAASMQLAALLDRFVPEQVEG